ncbi:hypothetical protein FA95DRAFT_1579753 [Auriscalpium vulgare]|uniref:Uncharacterized protein n=1 Tax=Auriscalpium vulgare TaxID=40419 RepID=A0ACB8SAV5_9AGAM|nr:hypothetical protein FA95DRAFT_1579753 [Auriscalpium vulgare]
MQADDSQRLASTSTAAVTLAQEHPLPTTHFYSIEYPGYVRPTSIPQALNALGGNGSIDAAFRRNASKQDSLLELNLRPGNPFSHPIPGDIVATNNIVLKVVKRKRRKANPTENASGDNSCEAVVDEYTATAIGVIPKTARFRSMADYQFQPEVEDPISKLRVAIGEMDVDTIRNFRIAQEKEDYIVQEGSGELSLDIDPQLMTDSEAVSNPRSNLRLFPPPLFSRQTIAQNYNFKANPMSVPTTVVNEETGEETKRLINRMRWKGVGPTSIMFAERGVPAKPPPNAEQMRNTFDQKLLKDLEEVDLYNSLNFKKRPVWTRASLFNQFSPDDAREIHNSKVILSLVCYIFQDGPWRDTLVRFGYDPRDDPAARFYQRLYFRNLNHPIARPSVVTRRQESRYSVTSQNRTLAGEQGKDERNSHVFDGQTLSTETAAFQLCDITDPMLREMIEDEEETRETCNERDGWYTAHALERIKAVLRFKFFSLLEGYVATDEECEKLLEQQGSASTVKPFARRLRPGRHNLAKGALPPEEAAAMRLRAALEKKAKGLKGQSRH